MVSDVNPGGNCNNTGIIGIALDTAGASRYMEGAISTRPSIRAVMVNSIPRFSSMATSLW